MPSNFLKNRYRQFVKEIGGDTTVTYIELTGTPNPLTGEYNDSNAYSGVSKVLPATVSFSNSRANRATEGLSVQYDANIRLSAEDLSDNSITVKIGDAFLLPGKVNRYYVVRVEERKQKESEYLELMVYVSRQVNRRG